MFNLSTSDRGQLRAPALFTLIMTRDPLSFRRNPHIYFKNVRVLLACLRTIFSPPATSFILVTETQNIINTGKIKLRKRLEFLILEKTELIAMTILRLSLESVLKPTHIRPPAAASTEGLFMPACHASLDCRVSDYHWLITPIGLAGHSSLNPSDGHSHREPLSPLPKLRLGHALCKSLQVSP
ncbi:hypothetical protein RRG08_041460 [Elysia crispata]|uniref:Uncharacterized protein n=1 Tax=Elysia crispata TaxID=231223 RepID=A0AAE0Y2H6_9GAST|nr:hypothetical protein RRG08_041460 [Elysia crispata]